MRGEAVVGSSRRNDTAGALAVAVVAMVVLAPLVWGAGLPRGHDLVLELVRIEEFAAALHEGVVRPRWAANLNGGYGYPIFDFFPLVLLYLAGIPRALGVPLEHAVELAHCTLFAIGALGSAALGRDVGGRPGAIVLPVVFVAAPYLAHDLYVRNAWSELAAMCLAPGALAATLAAARRPSGHTVAAAGGLLALFGVAHNLSAAMYAPIFAAATAVAALGAPRVGLTRRIAAVTAAVGLGLLCAATYLVPIAALGAFVAIQFEPSGAFDVLNNLIALDRVVADGWGPTFAFVAIGVVAAVLNAAFGRRIDAGLALALALLLFAPTDPFRVVWEEVDSLRILQFGWRLYSPATLLAAIAIARLASTLHARWQAKGPATTVGGVLLLALALVASAQASREAFSQPRIDDPAIGAPERLRAHRVTTTTLDEFVPRTVEVFPDIPAGAPLAWHDTTAQTTTVEYTSHAQLHAVRATSAGELLLRTFHFPGWTVLVDDDVVEPRVTRRGTMAIALEPGDHLVRLEMRRTRAHRVGDGLSVLGLLVVAGLLVGRRRPTAVA